MVSEKSTGDVYAMKIMKKSNILQQADVSVCVQHPNTMEYKHTYTHAHCIICLTMVHLHVHL